MSDVNHDYDIIVIGGGLAGLAFAALLKPGLRIAVVEQRPPAASSGAAPLDLRVSALAPAARAIMATLGVWDTLPATRVHAYRNMCVWQEAGAARTTRSISFAAAELGVSELGFIAENEAVRAALWQRLQVAPGVELLTDRSFVDVVQEPDRAVVTFSDNSVGSARLLVGADGARSRVRDALGVRYSHRAYEQMGLVAHVETALPHEDTAWQRFLRTGPVALLPLADGRSSLVWSCPDSRAQELLAMDEALFAGELERALDAVLGSVRVTTSRATFPLAMGYAQAYTGRRFALLGDAAHRVHPLAGQGANLGLLDAAVLAECLNAHCARAAADPGDPLALRRYERARKGDNLVTMGVMDLLQRVFASPLAEAAGAGMQVVDRLGPLKRRLAEYAMGRGRDLPAAARLPPD